jgi:carbon storage regulator
MLVLSRKAKQSFQIGDHVTVTICGIHGNKARIGIEAPPTVQILRTEIKERFNGEESENE